MLTNRALRIAELPVPVKLPLEVQVVAWQFARGVELPVQTAAPVEQTIQIEKPCRRLSYCSA